MMSAVVFVIVSLVSELFDIIPDWHKPWPQMQNQIARTVQLPGNEGVISSCDRKVVFDKYGGNAAVRPGGDGF